MQKTKKYEQSIQKTTVPCKYIVAKQLASGKLELMHYPNDGIIELC